MSTRQEKFAAHKDTPSTFEQSVKEIATALVREFDRGVDVGELLTTAATVAQLRLDKRDAFGSYLTDNRPGSWEAALVAPMISDYRHEMPGMYDGYDA